MTIKDQLIQSLKSIIKDLGGDFEPAVDPPAIMKHGDFTTNAAMVLAKKLKRNPVEIAEELKKNFPFSNFHFPFRDKNVSIIEKIEIIKPGFINFWLSKEYLLSELDKVIKDDNLNSKFKNSKFMVEFAHPNTHKALHIGHIRNISTGEALVRLLEVLGVKVIRANYQGDVGMHIAKAMYALLDVSPYKEQIDNLTGVRERVTFLGKAYAAGSQAYESDEKAKQKIHDYNYLIYASAQKFQEEKGVKKGSTDYLNFVKGRKEDLGRVYDVWKETRQWSLDYYEEMYKRLRTHFDKYYFESECLLGVDLAKYAVRKGVLTESEGAIIFKGDPYNMETRVFVNSLGLPTYEAKELALAEKEFSEFGEIDKLIHIVGPEQSSFFKVTFKVEELLNPEKYKNKQVHMAYGWVRLKQGKMSSRLGNVVTAEQLLDEVRRAIGTVLDKSTFSDEDRSKIIEIVSIAAIKYSFLKVSINQEIAFDLQESISFEGNSGPYLQYTYVRTQSVFRKAQMENVKWKMENLQASSYDMQPSELDLLRLLVKFNDVVQQAAEKMAPNILCNYLFILAQSFNLFYQKLPILKPSFAESFGRAREKEDTRTLRLALTDCTGKVIKSGLNLLGIEAPEKM